MKCYICCTKSKPYLLKIKSEEVDFMCNYKQWLTDNNSRYQKIAYNGKIVASFDLNKITHINSNLLLALKGNYCKAREVFDKVDYSNKELKEILEKSCLTLDEMLDYSRGKNLSAWHIENLQILDEPIELNKFRKPISEKWLYYGSEKIEKAPQSWCYANYNNELCIIISIKPERVCKILNREKTIEVRKIAPKGLIKNE